MMSKTAFCRLGGLAVALASGTIGLVAGDAFLSPSWLSARMPAVGKLGTPLLFEKTSIVAIRDETDILTLRFFGNFQL